MRFYEKKTEFLSSANGSAFPNAEKNDKGARQSSKIVFAAKQPKEKQKHAAQMTKSPATTPAYVTRDETAFHFTAASECASG